MWGERQRINLAYVEHLARLGWYASSRNEMKEGPISPLPFPHFIRVHNNILHHASLCLKIITNHDNCALLGDSCRRSPAHISSPYFIVRMLRQNTRNCSSDARSSLAASYLSRGKRCGSYGSTTTVGGYHVCSSLLSPPHLRLCAGVAIVQTLPPGHPRERASRLHGENGLWHLWSPHSELICWIPNSDKVKLRGRRPGKDKPPKRCGPVLLGANNHSHVSIRYQRYGLPLCTRKELVHGYGPARDMAAERMKIPCRHNSYELRWQRSAHNSGSV